MLPEHVNWLTKLVKFLEALRKEREAKKKIGSTKKRPIGIYPTGLFTDSYNLKLKFTGTSQDDT